MSLSPDLHHHLFLARLSEQAERFDDMALHMASAAKLSSPSQPLSSDDRNLLSAAFKSVFGSRRSAWRLITAVEGKEQSAGNEDSLAIVRRYRAKIEAELTQTCDVILKLLDDYLIPAADSAESRVFCLKMKGDYHRYLAEVKTGEDRNATARDTLSAYKSAQDIAMEELPPTHPIRLGLALNFSVFHYEILDSPERACELAKKAFNDAVSELDILGEESYKDSTLIMQLLRDNLMLWTSDVLEDNSEQMSSLNLNDEPMNDDSKVLSSSKKEFHF